MLFMPFLIYHKNNCPDKTKTGNILQLKELAAKQESLFNDIVSYAARNKQAAMEKAQAAAARQEEARRAMQRQETELR